jgi:hypothetical protein
MYGYIIMNEKIIYHYIILINQSSNHFKHYYYHLIHIHTLLEP